MSTTPTRPLGELSTVITKGTTPTTLGRAFVDKGINFIKVETIDDDGFLLPEKLAKIDGDTHALLRRSQIEAGDILFSIAGAIGRAAMVDSNILPANTNQAVAIIRPDSRSIDLHYLYYYLRSPNFQRYSLGMVVQTAQANVSLSVLSTTATVSG